jgi:aminomethyltransferase
MIQAVAIVGKGIARAGDKVFVGQQHVGHITSGTMVPYWKYRDDGITIQLTGETGKRAIGLALLDSKLGKNDDIEIEVRGRRIRARIVSGHLMSHTLPYARAVVYA